MYVQPFQFTQPIKLFQANRSVYNSSGVDQTDDIKSPVLTPEENKKLYDLLFAKFKYTNQHIFFEGDGQQYLITLQRYLMHIKDNANLDVLQTIVNDSKLGIQLRTPQQLKQADKIIADYTAKIRRERVERGLNPGGHGWL